ncbi:MAG TPA: hypothetical protein VHZ07_20760 [Bryobacteraceae bacterium]|nr:hypothetical protein [Bryobacteraceae bacterium]
MVRTFSIVSVLIFLGMGYGFAQDATSGLGRIYIQPFNGSFEKILGFEIVREHIPVVLVDSPKSADCVLGWTTVPGVAPRTDFVLVDRQTRTVTWAFSVRSASLTTSKRNGSQKITTRIVHNLAKAGAYCGGAAFSAPTQSADQRVKDFKPPTFNW